MSVLPCVMACVIAHGSMQVSSPASVAAAAEGTVRFARPSELFGPNFTVRPSRPGPGQVIEFTDPWGNRGGMNSCVASGVWGAPSLVVDHAARQIRVDFTGGEFQTPPDKVCPTGLDARRGLIGQFSALEPGQWTYQAGDLAPHTFTVVPEPFAGTWFVVAGGVFMCRRRRLDRVSVLA